MKPIPNTSRNKYEINDVKTQNKANGRNMILSPSVSSTSQGLSILKRAYADSGHSISLGTSVPQVAKDVNRSRRNFSYSKALEMLEKPLPDGGQKSRSRILFGEGGTESIAWYVPYRSHNIQEWGIYLDILAMNEITLYLADKSRQLKSNILNSSVFAIFYAEVIRHEVEHAIQDIVMAQAINEDKATLEIVSDPNFRHNLKYLETIASHFEHTDPLRLNQKVSVEETNIIRFTTQSLLVPPEYGDWKNRDILELDLKYHQALGNDLKDSLSSEKVRKLTRSQSRSDFIAIPVYAWLPKTEMQRSRE